MENTTTPETPETPELQYDATAKIVIYNAENVLVERNAYTLTSNVRNLHDYMTLAAKNRNNVDSLKEYLIENYDDLELHADEIAKIFGIELERTYTVDVTISATLTLTLPVGKDIHDVSESDFNVSIEAGYWNSDVTIDDYNIDNIDFSSWSES